MAICTLKLVDGVVVKVREDYATVRAALLKALADGMMFEIRDARGHTVMITVCHVIYVDDGGRVEAS